MVFKFITMSTCSTIAHAFSLPSSQFPKSFSIALSHVSRVSPHYIIDFADSRLWVYPSTEVRGPSAAQTYSSALSLVNGPSSITSISLTSNISDSLPNPYSQPKQEVLVLRGGFTEFQALYRNDEELVEKFDKNVWGPYAQ